jgi:DNA-binding transcriptional LysR family regulator
MLLAIREIRSALARALHQIDALKRGQSGAVILGVVSTGKYFAPDLVARLRRALPGINVVLRVKNRQGIIDALAGRELDIVIMGRPPRVPAVHARVLGDHPHMLVAAPYHRLAGLATIAPEDLLDEHFIMREPGSGTRILCTRYLDELGAGREVDSTEMESNETIKQAVMSGLGIALLSGHTMVEELRTGRLVALHAPNLPIVRQWFLVRRIDVPLTGALNTVSDWISECSSEFLPRMQALRS